MSGAKLAVAKQAVDEAIGRLEADDRFSVVVYDDQVEVVIDSTPATAEARRGALDRLGPSRRGAAPTSATAGCAAASRSPATSRIRRQPLPAADGRPRQRRDHRSRTSSPRHAAELRARGVSTSTFGVGNDFDEQLLQALADAGGGHFYYIADAPRSATRITSEVGETLEVVARDVALEVTARDDIRVESISPYPVDGRAVGGRSSRSATSAPSRSSRSSCGSLPVRRDRPGDRRHRGPDRSRRRLRPAGGDRAARFTLELRRRRGQRRPAARRRRRPGGRPPVRGPRPPGGRPRATATATSTVRRPAPRRDARTDRGLRRARPGAARPDRELEAEQIVFAAPMAEASRKSLHYASANLLRSRDARARSMRAT